MSIYTDPSAPGVLVTDSVLTIMETSYPLRNITSVSVRKIPAQIGFASLLFILGGGIAAIGSTSIDRVFYWGAGGMFALIALILMSTKRTEWALVITTSGVQKDALVLRDSDAIIRLKLVILERMK